MRIHFIHRVLAVFLVKLMLLDIAYPTLAWALTGGPSQPEFESFEPVGTDQMVDLFTGDFTYNIPLLTVPGPNGGYPINLAYHGGVSMEQEASWVGLGWNINAGVVNRMNRGLPDDFDGDLVTKTMKMRPNKTYGLSFGKLGVPDQEFLGFEFDAPSTKAMLYVNNYKGLGARFDLGLSSIVKDQNANSNSSKESPLGINTSFDTQNGFEVTPSLSFQKKTYDDQWSFSIAASLHGHYGLRRLDVSANNAHRLNCPIDYPAPGNGGGEYTSLGWAGTTGTGIGFSANSYVPAPFARTTGKNVRAGFSWGPCTPGTNSELLNAEGLYSETKIRKVNQVRQVPAYGYLYSEDRQAQETALMDFNRDKDQPITRRSPNAPMPVATYDAFIVNGQGTGGVFRPYRSDIGILHDEAITNYSHGAEGSLEMATPTGTPPSPCWKFGFDAGYSYGSSYTGTWKHGAGAIQGGVPLVGPPSTDLRFQAKTANEPLYEPFYFRMAGERTASPVDQWDHLNGGSPVRFDLAEAFGSEDGFIPTINADPRLRNRFSSDPSNGIPANKNKRNAREVRVQNIEYRTIAQIRADVSQVAAKHFYSPGVPPTSAGSTFDFSAANSDLKTQHIGEVSVLNPDGSRYVYGIPAYNTQNKEVSFAIDPGNIGEFSDPATAQWPAGTSPTTLVDHEMGEDHFYAKQELPPYAHSYLLTAIYSADYVDLNGDGPTDDDLGYFVKFNYHDAGSQNWRSPYNDVNYVKGRYSNPRDDKASYAFGEKKVYFLHSVETKTHYALFHTSDRADARGAVNEKGDVLNATNSSKAKRLDKIELFSKNEPTRVLKTIRLNYASAADELCQGVPNRYPASGGKLTLRSVSIEHLGMPKGSLSPYRFTYDNTQSYGRSKVDRWGNFKDQNDGGLNTYVDQGQDHDADRDLNAAAWCLTAIQLPSGGKIQVDYESDDYTHVQNVPAMQMFKIVGTSSTDLYTVTPDLTNPGSVNKEHRRIYIDLGREFTDPGIRAHLTDGLRDVYFKTWMRLKKKPLGDNGLEDAFDYVEGYARIAPGTQVGLCPSNPQWGYFDVQMMHYGGAPQKDIHPFRLAGLQYLRYERPDLITPQNDVFNNSGIGTALMAAYTAVASSLQMLASYYNFAVINGWCNKIEISTSSKDSFVRLNTPSGEPFDPDGQANPLPAKILAGKFGGGHRVKRVKVLDNWTTEGERQFGKEYGYWTTNSEGVRVSSGVAEYEPLLGGEEIALRKPIWYNGSDARINLRHRDVYLEEPLGEALYPGANVGYSRVVVTDLQDASVNKSAGGVLVNEFYTAKDFPVRVEHTDLESVHFAPPAIPIPLIGSIAFNTHGYSQGYAVHLNDMHGKPKAQSTYAHCADLDAPPKTRTSYRYNTLPGNPQALSSKAQVLTDHFQQQTMDLGKTTEFYVDLAEHNDMAIEGKLNTNIHGTSLLPFPMAMPGFEMSKSKFRSVVTTKVIHTLGILGEVVNEVDGATANTETLLYDASTGEPLLTVVNNPYEDPVFTYQYAAHMAYEGMSGAYKNWGAEVSLINPAANGWYDVSPSGLDATAIFMKGDEVVTNTGLHCWVEDVSTTSVLLMKANDSPPATTPLINKVRIVRSARRNMQSVKNGSIVALNNPLDIHYSSALFDGFNATVHNGNTSGFYYGCDNEYHATAEIQNNETLFDGMCLGCQSSLIFHSTLCSATAAGYYIHLFFADDLSLPIADYTINGFTGQFTTIGNVTGQEVKVTDDLGGVHYGVYSPSPNVAPGNPPACFANCMRVIHADATNYADQWANDYDYADVGSPQVNGSPLQVGTNFNPYRYGQRGIWRPVKNHLYQVDRLNPTSANTDIRHNGEYDIFSFFDFAVPSNNTDDRWVPREEMTRYSPYGFALESKDANGIFSSELYGYGQSMVTASAVNATYHEVAYDGFEDQPSTYQTRGHLAVQGSTTLANVAHTGTRSLVIPTGTLASKPYVHHVNGSSPPTNWSPQAGQRYVVSAWFQGAAGTDPGIVIQDNGVPFTSQYVHSTQVSKAPIEGWRKVDVEFTVPPTYTDISIHFDVFNATGNSYVDDIRIHPADGSMTTYVYDKGLYWLKAQLDDRNYATFYNYDEEGVLVQVKQETERGVMTLRTTRQNSVTTIP